jgi:ribose transport system ATP-binding protein
VGRLGVDRALEARHLSKSFGGTRALDDVAITIARGEIHALVGENGSGKSTLIKILAGYHTPQDGGLLEVAGCAVTLPLRPGQARELGLGFVHQELGLIPSLSVVENLRLEELAEARRRCISWARERRKANETFAQFGVKLDPRARVGDLRAAQRAQLATMRALVGVEKVHQGRGAGARTLVLDETSGYLSGRERERFLALVRAIASDGVGVLFVSHDLAEARSISDTVTVLRDGRNAGTAATNTLGTSELVELVVGQRPRPPHSHKRPQLPVSRGHRDRIRVSDLIGDEVRGVSLELSRGEIVGLAGSSASGHEEVPYLLYGARRARAGVLTLDAAYELRSMTPQRALKAGIVLVVGDRRAGGVVTSLSVEANLTLPVLDREARRGRLRRRRLRERARRVLIDFGVRPADPRLHAGALSGGNQQKLLLAKWLQLDPPLLLLHEPTRGTDVGARAEIIATLRRRAAAGAAVICASDDHEELALICDRVLIFRRGMVRAELAGAEVDAPEIAAHCLGAAGTSLADADGGSIER